MHQDIKMAQSQAAMKQKSLNEDLVALEKQQEWIIKDISDLEEEQQQEKEK